ncbi:MAG: aminotransferase class V-fold PLP-dependent enzyme [Arenicellales bacterium]|nr:aminotransferase class V-fold PLP-dependent enzyme [Arenicellales bacterium]
MTLPFENFTRVINARGTYTPLGVSRSPEPVVRATAESLRHFFDMEQLADQAGHEIARITGAEWGCVTHCTAASITLSCAALMTGINVIHINQLPNTTGMRSGIVIQGGHLVNYGHPIEQAVRLSGAKVLSAGTKTRCTSEELYDTLRHDNVAGLLLVKSRLCQGDMVPVPAAISMVHELGLPVIVDAAAQDLQMEKLLSLGADLTLFSGQKYLASPTAGLVIGKRDFVQAVHAQERGIGRGMKAGKEAIVGVIAALQYRHREKRDSWIAAQKEKADVFAQHLNDLDHVRAELVEDPLGNPFSRVRAWIDQDSSGVSARDVEKVLSAGAPMIVVQDHAESERALMFEIVALNREELETICSRLATILPDGGASQ